MNYFELSDAYFEKFGDWFPNMDFQSDSEDDLMMKMRECLNKGIPAEELYNLSNDNTVNY